MDVCAQPRFGSKCTGLLALTLLVCAAAAQVPLPDGAARVVSVMGQVSVFRNGDLWASNVNDVVPAGQEIVSGPDGHAELVLSDGSRFEVFPNSRVIFKHNRGNWRDLLDVLIGKVRVHIEKIGGRPNPYRVNSPTALIAVRGTTFEVEVEPNTATVVSVVEGLVSVEHLTRPGKSVELKGGESIRVLPTEPLAQVSPAKWPTIRRVMDAVIDQAIAIARSGGAGSPGGSTPGAGTAPTTGPVGTPVPGTSGSGTTTPPTGGRPGDGGGDDVGPTTPTTPTTPTPTTPTTPKPSPPRGKGGG